MKTASTLALTLLLAGCAAGPDALTSQVAPGNAQVRLSQVAGAVEAGTGIFAGADVTGASCVFTVLGVLSVGTVVSMQQGTCAAQVVGVGSTESEPQGEW